MIIVGKSYFASGIRFCWEDFLLVFLIFFLQNLCGVFSGMLSIFLDSSTKLKFGLFLGLTSISPSFSGYFFEFCVFLGVLLFFGFTSEFFQILSIYLNFPDLDLRPHMGPRLMVPQVKLP